MKLMKIFVTALVLIGLVVFAAGCVSTPQANNGSSQTPAATQTAAPVVTPGSSGAAPVPTILPERIADPTLTVTVEKPAGFDSPGSIVFKLPANPTTGYLWNVVSADGLNVSSEYVMDSVSNEDGLVLAGAGGTQVYTLRANKTGTYTFAAGYKRSWENEPIYVFKQEVTLNPENNKTMVLNFDGNVNPKTGDTVKITVAGNPTTGYTWSAGESEGLKLIKEDYIVDNHAPGMVGVGGKYYWYVTADTPGTYRFSLQNGRSWEDTFIASTSFDLTFS